MTKILKCFTVQSLLLCSCSALSSYEDKVVEVRALLPDNTAEVTVSTWRLGQAGRHENSMKKVLKGRAAELVLQIVRDNKAELVDARDKVLRFRAGMGTYDGAYLEILVKPSSRHAYYSLELSEDEREAILSQVIYECDF